MNVIALLFIYLFYLENCIVDTTEQFVFMAGYN